MGNGAISATVRFICHVPMGILAYLGTSHYVYVYNHAKILLIPPYNNHKILAAEGFAGPGVIVAFFWNFFFWIATISASNKTLLYYGLVDAIIVSCLTYALSVEATFVGFTRPQCASVHANATADPHLLFFDRAGTLNMTDTGLGQAICGAFLTKWYVMLVITILYFISASCNLYIGFILEDNYGSFAATRPARRKPMQRILGPFGYPLMLAWELVRTIHAVAFGWLPGNIQGHIRYSFRFARRWTRYKSSSAASKLSPRRIHLPRYLHTSKASDEKLAQMLLSTQPHDILQLIAANVHYVDLVALSLASKRVRAVMFPGLEDTAEDRQLRFHSCSGDEKSTCWTCGVQVCKVCWRNRTAADSTTSSHMRLCEARCSNCFRESLSRPSRERRPCTCTAPRSWFGPVRHVCEDCNKLKGGELAALREKRDRMVFHRLTMQSLACAKCKELLPRRGARWWVHSSCGGECRATCHPGYIAKAEV